MLFIDIQQQGEVLLRNMIFKNCYRYCWLTDQTKDLSLYWMLYNKPWMTTYTTHTWTADASAWASRIIRFLEQTHCRKNTSFNMWQNTHHNRLCLQCKFWNVIYIFQYLNKLCVWRHDMSPPLSSLVGTPVPRTPPTRCNVAVVSHAQYVLTVTAAPASRVKAAASKAAWWPGPWKWCPSHVWRGLPLCQF